MCELKITIIANSLAVPVVSRLCSTKANRDQSLTGVLMEGTQIECASIYLYRK